MVETGASPTDLLNAPAELVDAIAARLSHKAERAEKEARKRKTRRK